MNTMKLYSVRDLKGDYYISPFAMRNNAEAVRAFGDQIRNDNAILHFHPADFDLVLVGEFDVNTGVVSVLDHVVLANGLDFVSEKGKPNEK